MRNKRSCQPRFKKKFFTLLAFIIIAAFSLVVNFGIYAQQTEQMTDSEGRQMFQQVKNPEGVDFWLCFMKNFKEPDNKASKNELHLELFLTGDEDANVSIEIKNIGFKREVFIPASTVKSVVIDPLAQITQSGIRDREAAIHITSDTPISVYGLNRRFQTTDTYLGLPKRVLGKSYRAVGYEVSDGLMSQFAVAATEDQTIVTITPTVNTQIYPGEADNELNHKAGETFKVRLDKGDVYQVSARDEKGSKCDLTGSHITSDKKIAVFSGHQCAYVPPRIIACNHLVEQLPPLNSWGKHFYIGNLHPRSKYTYRVLADKDSTKVFEDAQMIRMLQSGEYLERISDRNVQVTADKPVLVAQYSQGFKNGDSIGDPMMILVSPTQQFLRKYRFATPVNGQWKHYVNVVAPTKSINTIRLNNNPVDESQFEKLGISRYSIAYLQIPFGTHIIEGAMPFGLYSYGFGYGEDAYDAYGTMGGQSFIEYEAIKDTLPPMADPSGEEGQMKVIFRDDRINDTGIMELKVYDSENIRTNVPQIEEGLPQLQVSLSAKNPREKGRVTMKVKDISLNEATYTICYKFDVKAGKYIFSLNEGENVSCESGLGIHIGAFGKFSAVIHKVDFSASGNVTAFGDFSDAFGTGGYTGLYFNYGYKEDISLTGRLSFDTYGGTLEAADTLNIHIRDTVTGELVRYQEAGLLEAKGVFMHLGLGAEWYLKDYLYLAGGLNIAFTLSDAISYKKRILMPEEYTFENGERTIKPDGAPSSMGSMNTIRLGFFGGAGVTYPILNRFSAYAEANYSFFPGNMISDGGWKIQQISIILGIKYLL